MVKTLFIFFFAFLINKQNIAKSVYVTPYGKCYHKGNCIMVENVSKELKLNNAINLGYKPCKICKPPIVSNANQFPINKPRGESSNAKCKGITATGKRCKHKTSIANGYCFQHNPERKK
jgi:hypothetical protein